VFFDTTQRARKSVDPAAAGHLEKYGVAYTAAVENTVLVDIISWLLLSFFLCYLVGMMEAPGQMAYEDEP